MHKMQAEKLVLEHFPKNQICDYLWNNSLKCYKFVFIVCPSRGLPKFVKTKVLNTC